MKKIMWLLTLAICLSLSACGSASEMHTLSDPAPEQLLESSNQGLTLSLHQTIYTEGISTFHTTLINSGETSYEYGEYYHIELLKNEQWYTLSHSDAVFYENPYFTNLGRLLAPGKVVHQTFSTETIRVQLVPGQYRLVKMFLKPVAPYYVVNLAVPFTVVADE